MPISRLYISPFCDFTALGGDNLAERYEQTMARLQRITSAGYTVELVWECQFDRHPTPPSRTETASCSSSRS